MTINFFPSSYVTDLALQFFYRVSLIHDTFIFTSLSIALFIFTVVPLCILSQNALILCFYGNFSFQYSCTNLEVQKRLIDLTGKQIEVMVYGDGAFKDPVGKIWELADPVVSPAHTSGLIGYPNEIKLKYVSDNKFAHLRGDELKEAIKEEIKQKDEDLTGQMITEGTTPRVLTDLIGSLCDLTSGSGDKGIPVIFIQGYFDNLSHD